MRAMTAASSGMGAQAHRLQIVSENLSNADTHGYQRKMLTFAAGVDALKDGHAVTVSSVGLDRSEGELSFDPSHPLADSEGFVRLSNVSMMVELADAREAGRSYEANLTTFKQATQMYSSLISLLQR